MVSFKNIARISGIGYLIIFLTGIFANFFVLESLVVPEDANTTIENMANNAPLFRLGLLGFLIMVICDVVLAWGLYILLRPVNQELSLLSAWLRLVNATIFGVALYHLLSVLPLTSDSVFVGIFTFEERSAQVMLSLSSFNHTWLLGLVFFGVHLLILGYLITKAGNMPKMIGVLLIIAGVGYLIDSFANFIMSNYADHKDLFALLVIVPGIIGELSFTGWLLWRGFSKSTTS